VYRFEDIVQPKGPFPPRYCDFTGRIAIVPDQVHPGQVIPIEELMQGFHKKSFVMFFMLMIPWPPCILGLRAIYHAAWGGFLALMSAPFQR
jgi:hypothetical protein